MTPVQIFGLILGCLMLVAAVYVFRASRALLADGRERRRYKALVDEDRARDAQLKAELDELEVQAAMSGFEGELRKLLTEGPK